jgi:hypothetical protein
MYNFTLELRCLLLHCLISFFHVMKYQCEVSPSLCLWNVERQGFINRCLLCVINISCRSQWPRCRLVAGSRFRIPLGAWMFVSSFPFPFVPLQLRGCLVAPWFLWIVLGPHAGDYSSDRGVEWRGECDRVSKRDRLRLTPDLTTRDLWRSRRWAKGKWEKYCLFTPVGLQEFFYMP